MKENYLNWRKAIILNLVPDPPPPDPPNPPVPPPDPPDPDETGG